MMVHDGAKPTAKIPFLTDVNPEKLIFIALERVFKTRLLTKLSLVINYESSQLIIYDSQTYAIMKNHVYAVNNLAKNKLKIRV